MAFDRTPSFYSNREVFEKYLGHTSYYVALQQAMVRVARLSQPRRILDLASGTGDTTVALAAHAESVTALDMRESMRDAGQELARCSGVTNAEFAVGDMTEYVREHPIADVDLVSMMYAFHHILDPLDRKRTFLRDVHGALRPGALLCIGETFLPWAAEEVEVARRTRELWQRRPGEGYASTFWWTLESLDASGIEHAHVAGEFSRENEALAGDNVLDRNEEYLVTREWLEAEGRSAGFQLVLSEPVNEMGDGVVLLRR
jgi:ubiquinone/menaquinone biosynthesis C-methylase UbiE